jgi:hypothetical protein
MTRILVTGPQCVKRVFYKNTKAGGVEQLKEDLLVATHRSVAVRVAPMWGESAAHRLCD